MLDGRVNRFVSRVFCLTFFGLILLGCHSIPSDKKTLVLGEDGWNSNCISLRAIKIDDDGAALLFFEKPSYDGYSMCHTALVTVDAQLSSKKRSGERYNIFGTVSCPKCNGDVRHLEINKRRAFVCDTCQPLPNHIS